MTIGERLRALREAQGLTQRELAQRVGVVASLISMIESGARPNPEYSTIKRLARALKVPLSDLDPDLTEADFPNARSGRDAAVSTLLIEAGAA